MLITAFSDIAKHLPRSSLVVVDGCESNYILTKVCGFHQLDVLWSFSIGL